MATDAMRTRSKADRRGRKFRIWRVDLADKEHKRPAPWERARRGVSKRDCSSLDHMSHLTSAVFVGLALFWGLFASGCSARRAHSTCSGGTHCMTKRSTLLAQAATMDCRPGDSTMTCCIKKHPQDPVGACGATQSEVDQVLRAVRTGSDVVDEDEDEDNFANNASLPKWKQKCIKGYNECIEDQWTGNCHDCLRLCEGSMSGLPRSATGVRRGGAQMTEETDWDEVRELSRDVLENGAPLVLTGETRALLSRTAQQVAINQQDAEDALRSIPAATTLLREIRRRIHDGSWRLTGARNRAGELRDAPRQPSARPRRKRPSRARKAPRP
ncbi:MAG TPA: DUF2379 family protein [Archangium sp.]|nr:DUF2379 family protein [Archangium sp.]